MLKRYFSVQAILLASSMIPAPARAADSPEQAIPFSRLKLFIEFNATDEDVGIQVLLDGEPWTKLRMSTPRERMLLDIVSAGSLQSQGLTELSFESSEPSLDELSLEEFLERFPEGKYVFEGVTIDGLELEGKAALTHVIPAGPEILVPVSTDGDPPTVDRNSAVIEWAPVVETIDGSPNIKVVGYQVVVEQEDPLRVFSIDLPASATSVTVPPDFFAQSGTLYAFEVLAIEASGNQTISSGEFVISP